MVEMSVVTSYKQRLLNMVLQVRIGVTPWSTNMTTLQVIDANGFLHRVTQLNESLGITDANSYKTFILRNVAAIHTGYLLESFCTGEVQTIWLKDSKPYWREYALMEKFNVNYKGKRQRVPGYDTKLQLASNLLDYALDLLHISTVQLRIAKERVLLSPFKEYLYKDLGYEADDLAAGICQKYSDKFDKIVFITDDSDWIPFVEKPNCYWLGIMAREPRIRTWDTCFDWIKISPMFSGSKAKKAFEFYTPSDIWRFKQIFGDTSDNIPGDKDPEVYKPYIDLFNPLIKCWEETDFVHAINLGLSETRHILHSAQVTEKLKNIPFIISPHYPHPTAWAS